MNTVHMRDMYNEDMIGHNVNQSKSYVIDPPREESHVDMHEEISPSKPRKVRYEQTPSMFIDPDLRNKCEE